MESGKRSKEYVWLRENNYKKSYHKQFYSYEEKSSQNSAQYPSPHGFLGKCVKEQHKERAKNKAAPRNSYIICQSKANSRKVKQQAKSPKQAEKIRTKEEENRRTNSHRNRPHQSQERRVPKGEAKNPNNRRKSPIYSVRPHRPKHKEERKKKSRGRLLVQQKAPKNFFRNREIP